eukprot:9390723-Lingulodinium_polyedra.AAC.1
MDWQLNAAKSRLWANSAGLRRWLAAEGGGACRRPPPSKTSASWRMPGRRGGLRLRPNACVVPLA